MVNRRNIKVEGGVVHGFARQCVRLLAVCALFGSLCVGVYSCAKYTVTCDFVLMPRRMIVESSPKDGEAYLVSVFAYYIPEGDIKNWRPASYADAEAGIITNIKTGEERSQGILRGQSDDGYVHVPVTSSPVLFVAVDAMDRFYAYGVFEYEIPMARMLIPIHFQLWKGAAPYADGHWTVISAEYEKGLADE